MEKDSLTAMLEEYVQQHGLYTDFTLTFEMLLKELLKQNGIRVHSITARVKDRASLEGKINRSEGKYTQLSQLTDLVGIRIITYFEDEVDSIADIVEQEFVLDLKNSVDKRTLHDPDRFGYMSLHYVVGLPEKRLGLTEYARFGECKAEIQIRSILQHTWAEIEHDLGYKSKQAIPKEIRRSFSRLAGLLEIADLEFAKIRDSLKEYADEVQEQITDKPEAVLIDQTSLKSYIANSKTVYEADREIVTAAQAAVVLNDDSFSGLMVERLHYFGLNTISDVDNLMCDNRELAVAFAKRWFARRGRVPSLHAGVSLFFLCYLLSARTGSLESVYRYLTALFPGDAVTNERFAKEIMMTYQELISREF